MNITIHSNCGKKEYFLSTDHCQGIEGRGKWTYPEGFVPITFDLPCRATPREGLPSGRVETLKDLLLVFFDDYKEIPNPDPRYQPKR